MAERARLWIFPCHWQDILERTWPSGRSIANETPTCAILCLITYPPLTKLRRLIYKICSTEVIKSFVPLSRSNSALFHILFSLPEKGKSLENFTYEDKEMADVFEDVFYNTSFLGVTVNTNVSISMTAFVNMYPFTYFLGRIPTGLL